MDRPPLPSRKPAFVPPAWLFDAVRLFLYAILAFLLVLPFLPLLRASASSGFEFDYADPNNNIFNVHSLNYDFVDWENLYYDPEEPSDFEDIYTGVRLNRYYFYDVDNWFMAYPWLYHHKNRWDTNFILVGWLEEIDNNVIRYPKYPKSQSIRVTYYHPQTNNLGNWSQISNGSNGAIIRNHQRSWLENYNAATGNLTNPGTIQDSLLPYFTGVNFYSTNVTPLNEPWVETNPPDKLPGYHTNIPIFSDRETALEFARAKYNGEDITNFETLNPKPIQEEDEELLSKFKFTVAYVDGNSIEIKPPLHPSFVYKNYTSGGVRITWNYDVLDFFPNKHMGSPLTSSQQAKWEAEFKFRFTNIEFHSYDHLGHIIKEEFMYLPDKMLIGAVPTRLFTAEGDNNYFRTSKSILLTSAGMLEKIMLTKPFIGGGLSYKIPYYNLEVWGRLVNTETGETGDWVIRRIKSINIYNETTLVEDEGTGGINDNGMPYYTNGAPADDEPPVRDDYTLSAKDKDNEDGEDDKVIKAINSNNWAQPFLDFIDGTRKTTSGIERFYNDVFSWIPLEIKLMISFGIAVSIILRILGR